jgi:hypothetical protein
MCLRAPPLNFPCTKNAAFQDRELARSGPPYNSCMQSKPSDEWLRLAKHEYGVWAFLILAGVLALSLIIYLGYMLV